MLFNSRGRQIEYFYIYVYIYVQLKAVNINFSPFVNKYSLFAISYFKYVNMSAVRSKCRHKIMEGLGSSSGCGYEVFCLLGVWDHIAHSKGTVIQRYMSSSPLLGLNNKTRKKPTWSRQQQRAYNGDEFLETVSWHGVIFQKITFLMF
jgi:hypothetical protein